MTFIKDLWKGVLSIKEIKRPKAFWFYTIGIWVIYFLMSYLIFFSYGPTAHLGIKAGLAVLIAGGIGMSAPVQGGIGTFHILVSSVLLLYLIPESEGQFFAFVVHSSQLLMVLVFGGISYIASLLIPERDSYRDVNKK